MLRETYSYIATRTVQPYAYGTEKHTIRVRYVPYAYGMYHTRTVWNTRAVHNIYIKSREAKKKQAVRDERVIYR